jgi:hypothetical protein
MDWKEGRERGEVVKERKQAAFGQGGGEVL